MTLPWSQKPNFIISFAITLLMTLQISACSTEDFAEAIADNIVSDVSETSNITEITNPDPASAPTPVSSPTAAVAMYSYNADLSNAQLLSGASLEQTTVYMFFNNTSQYSSMNFYCCKGIGGTSTGEAHSTPVRDSSAPFVYSVDLSQYSTNGTRELYVDATRTDGNGPDGIDVNFNINVTTVISSEPTPEPTPEPAISDVSLSWIAPSAREDDNPISLSEIAGYKIYYGTTQGNYNNSVNVNDSAAEGYTLNGLSSGTYYFAVTTKDTEGRESQFSSVVQIVI